MFYQGTFEPVTSQLIQDSLGKGGTFLDVGANAGHYTYLAAATVGSAGTVHAIEAAPLNAARLRADLSANHLFDRVVLHEVAVADRPGELRLQHAPGPSPHGMRYLDPAATTSGELVPVATIDDLLPDLNADAVKIDVEGADLRVLHTSWPSIHHGYLLWRRSTLIWLVSGTRLPSWLPSWPIVAIGLSRSPRRTVPTR
jgi:FkbM family methyltransferase